MRVRFILSLVLIAFITLSAVAQGGSDIMQPRILFVLDRSSSMVQPWAGGNEKSKIADMIIERLMDSVMEVNDQVEFSLRVFGHQHTVQENDCTDTKNEVPFSKANRTRIQYRLEDISPLGVTAIAYTLQQAAENDIVDEAHNAYSIILITDGGESCGGNICDVMERLLKKKIFFKPYILSLEADPQLRKDYACMGNYLEVTSKGDITAAVNTIVDAYKPMLNLTRSEYKHIQTIAASAPSVTKVNYPPIKLDTSAMHVDKNPVPKHDTVAAVPAKQSHIKVNEVEERPKIPVLKKVRMARAEKMFIAFKAKRTDEQEVPVNLVAIDVSHELPRPAIEKMPTVQDSRLHKQTVAAPVFTQATEHNVTLTPSEVKVPVKRETPQLTKLRRTRMRTYNHIFMVEEGNVPLLKLTLTPVVIKTPEAKTTTTTVKTPPPPAVPKRPRNTADYTVLPEEGKEYKESQLQVFLTDGKGKFFHGTPVVTLIDQATGKEYTHFYRTVDPNGDPDPQKNIPAGKYFLTIAGRDDLYAEVEMLPKKNIMVYVIVKKYTLFFEYEGNKDRPMKEFTATVTQRNVVNGKVVEQKCTEKKEYEPGNYHIVVHTLPETVVYKDLESDYAGGTKIPEPGYAKFTNQSPSRYVVLYHEDGDRFVSFYKLDLTAPAAQHLMIQPGKYQAHYQGSTAGYSSTEKVALFTVTSNQDTEVILK